MIELNELNIEAKYLKDLDVAEKTKLRHLLRAAFPGEDWVDSVIEPGDEEQRLFLGRVDASIVSAVGVVIRDIRVSNKILHVGGIGGVATLPEYRSRGFAARLIEEATVWMKKIDDLDFGMLFCELKMISYYERRGYRLIKNRLFEIVNEKKAVKDEQVMIMDLGKSNFPVGDIEVTGYTW